MPEVTWRGLSSSKPSKFMEVRVSRHRRSDSDPIQKKALKDKLNSNISETEYHLKLGMEPQKELDRAKKGQYSGAPARNTLKQEILQLQEKLQDQFVVRRALEKALTYGPFSYDITAEKSIPKDAKELIQEISVLELEVVYLEKYLLSLYRETFDQKVLPQMAIDEKLISTSEKHKEMFQEVPRHDIISEKEGPSNQFSGLTSSQNSTGKPINECSDIWGPPNLLDSTIYRNHSSLSQQSACSIRTSPQLKSLANAIDLYHSLPLSMLEQAHTDASNGTSLAEHLGTNVPVHVPETPNRLSEEIIRCISAIYRELADPPLINRDYVSSPVSCSSSVDVISAHDQGVMWSPKSRRYSSFNSYFGNPFSIDESKEYSGPYCTMIKVQRIGRDDKKLRDTEDKLQYYRSLVYQLEGVDPKRMKHEEKLAFWINVHNALVMHTFLVYGIPKNSLKRISLSLKAAYNVGGQIIAVHMIQGSILGCRLPRPGQWLPFLFPSKTKFKAGDARKAYGIEDPEPLTYFGLCSGSYSDPAVRVYTPTKVFQELEAAKDEYIQSNFSVNKEQKILLPKIVESFAKGSDICTSGLVQMVEQFMPRSLRNNIRQSCHRKHGKSIVWTPHNFSFRYLLSKELAH